VTRGTYQRGRLLLMPWLDRDSGGWPPDRRRRHLTGPSSDPGEFIHPRSQISQLAAQLRDFLGMLATLRRGILG
jgi:hypothetical protein